MTPTTCKDEKTNHETNRTNGETINIGTGELLNASGHVQELRRNFSLISLAGIGLVVGNVW